MDTGRKKLRKMLLAAEVLAVGTWLAPNLYAQTGTNPIAAGRAQKPSVRANPLPSALPEKKAVAQLGRMPMYFEENRGQTDARVKFLTRGRGYTLFLTEDEAVLALKKKSSVVSSQLSANKRKGDIAAVLRMRLAGAKQNPKMDGIKPLPGKIYYASGKETGPLQGNATYGRVKYAQVYPGIDLEYYGNESQLEFDFVLAPHADPKQIRLTFSGAEKIKLTKRGELSLRVSGEEIRLKKPLIYQERNGERTEIAGGYALIGKGKREAIFNLAPYDPSLPLVIDPQIDFATYLGGTGSDYVTDVRVTPTGEIYLLGQTDPATGFPSTQTIPPQGLYATDCFVSKLSADGSTLLYSAIFPGTQCTTMAVDLFAKVHLGLFDWGVGSFLRTLAEDSTGALALTPLQGAYDFNFAPAQHMQVDTSGNVYMVIFHYPPNSSVPEYGLFKVDASGQLVGTSTLLVPTFIPSPGGGQFQQDQITGLAVDDAGHAFVIGGVSAPGLITPTANAFQPTWPGNCVAYMWCDGIVLGIDTNTPNNFSISYASYLGGSGTDFLGAISVGIDGALYITGQTGSVDFPTSAGAYSTPLPSACASSLCGVGFVVKLDPSRPPSQQLLIGSVLSHESQGGYAIVALPGGLAAVLSAQSSFFVGVNPLNFMNGGASVVVLSSNGSSVVFSSYLEPDTTYSATTWMHRMTSNGTGKLFIAGSTEDPRVGLPGAFQQNLAGGKDALVRAISGIVTNSPPTVDLGPPITVSQPQFTLDCGNTLFCDIIDPDGDPLISYRWIGPNGFTAVSASAPPIASVQFHAGSNQITLIVTDNQGAVGVGTLTVNVVDTDPPVVIPPLDLQTNSTGPGGASGIASSLLHNFLFASATATDLLDPNPVALPPQTDFGAGPVDVDDNTLFPLGFWPVTFRFQDTSGNVGFAVSTVTITMNQDPSVFLGYSPLVATLVATSPAGANVTVYASATDPENDPLSFSWSGSTAGLTLFQVGPNNEQMSGVLPIGVHNIQVDVSDSHGGSATVSITITVSGINTTGPQTVYLFDDELQHQFFSSYYPWNPLGGHLVSLTFSNVLTPGLSYFKSRSDINPPPPAGLQAGSPPYYYDIGTSAGYSGNIDVCVTTTGMSFANPAAIQLYQLQGANWTALTSPLTSSTQLCGSTPTLGTFAIFYPEVPATAITTIAGNGTVAGSIDGAGGNPSDDDVTSGPATSIPLAYPRSGAMDHARNYLYFSDGLSHVRRLNLNTGILTMVFGNGSFIGGYDGPGGDPRDDFVEGTDPMQSPGQPIAITLDVAGNLYLRDANTCQVRKIDFTANTVTSVAGNGTCEYSSVLGPAPGDGGAALQASLSSAWAGLAIDSLGNLFLAELYPNRIRRVDAVTGIITTVAGTGVQDFPTPGVAATQSPMVQPESLAFDSQGHLLASLVYGMVVRISPGADFQVNGGSDEVLSVVAGASSSQAFANASYLPFEGDGGAATQANVKASHVSVASDGALILIDRSGMRIRRVSPGADSIVTGASDEMITTIAGYRYVFSGIGNFNGDTFATMASLAVPSSAFEDVHGGILVVDSNNNRIRRFGLSPFLATGQAPDLSVNSTASPDPVDTGGNLTYSVTVRNMSLVADGTGVFLDYPLPASVNFVSYSASQGTCATPATGSTGTVTCNLGTLIAGATATFSIVTTPTAAGPLAAVFTVSGNEQDSNRVDNTYTANVIVQLGPAVIQIVEQIVVSDAPALLPSAMIGVNEIIVVTDGPAVLPSAMIGVNENIVVTDGPAVLPSAMIGVNENIVVTDGPVVVPQDNTAPVVTAPPSLVVAATETGGARGNVSQLLHDFLLGGTATDAVDPNPQRLPPQANGADADDVTLFPVGATTVTFRFRDASNNIGAATTLVIVDPPIGGAVNTGGTLITPTDPNNTPMPLEITFSGVTQPGLVTAVPMIPPPAAPSGFQISGTVFDIVTTAIYTPPIEVCFVGSGFTTHDRIFHYLGGIWVDVTSMVTSTKICSKVNSLSPFAIAAPVNQAPSANAGPDQTIEAASPAGASVTLNGSGSDADGDALAFAWSGPCGPSATASATFNCPLGSNTMTLTAGDGHGGIASDAVVITVVDTTPPVLSLPANINAMATSASGAAVDYSATASDVVSGANAPSCSPASGATFPIGITAINCSATDTAGNSASGSFSVTVNTGTPRLSGAIAAKGRDASGSFYLDLRLTNTGTGHARNVRVAALAFRTLSGSGTLSFNASLSGALPLAAGDLNVGATATVRLYLNVPSTVTRFSITEGGTLRNVVGSSFNYSLAQSVIP